jgi:hypothetical protein
LPVSPVQTGWRSRVSRVFVGVDDWYHKEDGGRLVPKGDGCSAAVRSVVDFSLWRLLLLSLVEFVRA